MGEIDLLISFNKYERDHYVKRILRSAPELRKIHPEIEMTAIGCSGGDGRHLPRFKVMRSLWKDLKTVLDGVSPDQYTMPSTYGPGNQPVDSESGLLREIMLEAYKIIRRDNKSVLSIDEKGPHIVYDLPMNNPYARNMANVVVRDYVIVKSLPVKHWLYYGWNRWRDGGTLDYGMWKGPSPRHTVAAYAAAARLLANVKFVKKADLHKSVPFFLFTGKQGTVGVIWRSGNGKNISMMTRFPDDAKLFDVQGNEVKISSGGNTIELSDAPLYIFTKETPDQLASLLQKAKMSLPELGTTIVMQSRDKVLVYLNNLTNKKLIVDCSFAGVKRKLTLPASGAVQAEFPAGKSFLSGEELQVKTAQGFVYRNLFKIDPVPVGRVASFEALKKAAPTFKLDSAELHLNNIDYAANGLYSGPADCSVEVRMGYDDRNLYLNAVVTDDIHINESEQRVMAWSGDCIQFGFDPLSDAKIKALQGKNIFCDDDLLFTVAKMKRMDLFDTNFKPEGADLSKVRYSIKRDEKKKTTTYDAVIPLSSLTSLKVVPGTVFGFNFIAMDSDEAREIPKYWMQYSPGIAGGLNPALFKSFMFK